MQAHDLDSMALGYGIYDSKDGDFHTSYVFNDAGIHVWRE